MMKKKSVVVENEEERFAKNYCSAASEKSSKIEDHFTVACVNAFLVNASRNLNDIHAKSRKEVQKIEEKMRKMERSLVFLEKKLEGFDDDVALEEEEEEKAPVPAEFSGIAPSSSNAEARPPPSPPPPPRNDDEEEDNRIERKEASSVVVNPMHEKYHKMIRIGVPEQAVRNKMKLDGVDDSGVVF
jgi:hypothetical protein